MASSRRRFLLSAAAMGGVSLGGRATARNLQVERVAPSSQRAADAFSPTELLARHEPHSGLANAGTAPAQQSDPDAPTRAEIEANYTDRRNWGRWGRDDQVGAINLITPEKRAAAARLVRTGRTVSLSRVFEPPQQFIQKGTTGNAGGGYVMDYYGFIYHGATITHIDALCHIWDEDGIWQGRDPDAEIDTRGAKFGDITNWSGGIITKGVLLDVPRHRGEPHVMPGQPVHGAELEEISRAEGVSVDAGDALIVHSGWQAYQESEARRAGQGGPGLHASCAKFIRDHDVALLGWDLMDARPDGYGLPWPVHGVLNNYGVALMDNALLEPLAVACAEEGRYEFMFMLLPLRVAGGTGSPANPIAMF